MRIRVLTPEEREYILEVEPDETVASVKDKLRYHVRVPAVQQRLFLQARQLDDHRTLLECGIEGGRMGITLHLQTSAPARVAAPSAASSSAAPGTPSVLHRYTMLTDDERADTEPPHARHFIAAAQGNGANLGLSVQIVATGNTLLNAEHRREAMSFVDAAREQLAPGSAEFTVVFRERPVGGTDDADTMVACAAAFDMPADKVDTLLKRHSAERDKAVIALRRTEAPSSRRCGFYCDDEHAARTVELALNDDTEFGGGRLCFFTSGAGLAVPSRPAGTLTVHDREVFHGVTRLHRGVQLSLLVVDNANRLGEINVHCVSATRARDIRGRAQSAAGAAVTSGGGH